MSAAPTLSPRELLESVVRPNFLALQARRASFQHAYNTVLSADALVAHVYFTQSHQRHPKHDDGYREKLANERPEYRPLRDLAAALKHAELQFFNRQLPRLVIAGRDMTTHEGAFQANAFQADAFD